MNREEIFKTVQLIIREQMTLNVCGKKIIPDLISEDDTLKSLGMDSLDVLTIGYKLEVKFNISIDDIDWLSMLSVKDMVDAIMSRK